MRSPRENASEKLFGAIGIHRPTRVLNRNLTLNLHLLPGRIKIKSKITIKTEKLPALDRLTPGRNSPMIRLP